MAQNMDAAGCWRELAAQACRVAEELTDQDARRAMLHIAEGYRRVAKRAENSGDQTGGRSARAMHI